MKLTEDSRLVKALHWRMFLLVGLMSSCCVEASGTWSSMAISSVGSGIAELMSDGTVISMDGSGDCVKLTPDIHGSYANGTWTALSSMNYSRWNFGVAVLTNGQLFVTGGEYGGGSALGQYWDGSSMVQGIGQTAEIYDPVNNVWRQTNPNLALGDCPTELLPNGNVLVAPANGSGLCAMYEVASNRWDYGTIPASFSGWDECSWAKTANGCIFSVDDAGYGEHYVPSSNQWILDGISPLAGGGGENTSFLLPNGKVFYIGQVTNSAFYTAGVSPGSAGSWSNGPNLPVVGTNQLTAGGEGGGIMMANGNVLLILYSSSGTAYTYEYNYLSNAFTAAPPNPGSGGYELDLPDGTVFVAGGDIYTPGGSQVASGQPVINSITENSNGSYHLTGTVLNGFSEGEAAIDDGQASCNFPLVRMTNNVSGNVYYARTYNWSSGGVQTGTNVLTTEFSLPLNLPPGTYSLVAVAVGIPSVPTNFTYAPPPAPTGLTGTAGNAQTTLSWNAVSGATTYNVKHTSVGIPYYETVATVTGTSCTNTGLVNAFTYSYVVTAVGANGESSNSTALMLTPLGPPPIPAGLTAAPDTGARIDLAWNASYGAASYNIKRSTVHNGPYTTVANPVNPFFTDSGLTTGSTYYYVISAVSNGGESSNSAEVSATTQSIGNFGFEVPILGPRNYQYNPSGGTWTFGGTNGGYGSGIIANSSAFSNPNAPQGVQAAFVQGYGTISQTLSGFTPGTNYTITYSAAQRPGSSQTWNVTIDGAAIKTNAPGSTSYTTYTAGFTASAVIHTLAFVGTDLSGGDNTVFIDNVRISPALQPVTPVVMLTAPTNCASIIVPPAINLAASVATNGNLIGNVQFYYDATNLIGRAANPPYIFSWTNPSTGNHSVFARVIYNGGSQMDSSAAGISVINTNVNFSFETPGIGSGNYQYNPSLASWTFNGQSGLIANGSGFGNPNAPLGVQAAFVQSYGTISQMLYGFTPGTNYTITYSGAQRSGDNQHGGESWSVTIDGAVIKTNAPGGTSYVDYTATFTATASTHTLSFMGTDLAMGDNTVFIDNIRISPPISQLPPTVILTSPANNAVFSAANPVNFAAAVTTNGNTVVGVQFYSNTNNLITQVTAPYTYAWSNASAGASTVFARLVFNGTNTVDSSSVNITVTNPPPGTGVIGWVNGQTLSISGSGLPNRPYCLNTATNLTSPVVWIPILTNLSDGAGNIVFTNIAPTNTQQFFRLSAP